MEHCVLRAYSATSRITSLLRSSERKRFHQIIANIAKWQSSSISSCSSLWAYYNSRTIKDKKRRDSICSWDVPCNLLLRHVVQAIEYVSGVYHDLTSPWANQCFAVPRQVWWIGWPGRTRTKSLGSEQPTARVTPATDRPTCDINEKYRRTRPPEFDNVLILILRQQTAASYFRLPVEIFLPNLLFTPHSTD